LTGEAKATPGIQAIAFSSDGATLASAGTDGKVSLWDVKKRQRLAAHEIHKGRVRSLAWKPGSRVIASGGDGGVVHVWEADSARVLHHLAGFPGEVWSLAWSPDGKTLAAAGGWGDVRLWDPQTARPVKHLRGPTTPVLSLSWSPDGRRLASGGELATTHVWDAASGRVQAVLLGLPRDRGLAIGQTGHVRCPPEVENDLRYVVQTERGQETFTAKELARHFGWKNDPEQVRPGGD
jgi:WD40 repeat protein